MKNKNKTNKKSNGQYLPLERPDVPFVSEEFESETDTEGSYTGNPIGDDRPVQDADDL